MAFSNLQLSMGHPLEIHAYLCLDCGAVSLMADAEKVKGLTDKT